MKEKGDITEEEKWRKGNRKADGQTSRDLQSRNNLSRPRTKASEERTTPTVSAFHIRQASFNLYLFIFLLFILIYHYFLSTTN